MNMKCGSFLLSCVASVTARSLSLAPAVASTTASQIKTKPVTPATPWRISSRFDKMDEATEYQLSSRAVDSPAQLIVRCKLKKLEIYVATPDLIEPRESGAPRYKIDGKEIENIGGSISSGMRAIFAYEPEELLPKLIEGQRMLFQYTPYEERPKVISFRIAGLKRAMTEKIREACGISE